MSEVKRFSLGHMFETCTGEYVQCSDYTALAERLKSCERESKRAKQLHSEGIQNELDVIAERDQLTADLKDSSAEIVMNHQEIERLRADLERARAEVERLKNERQADRNLTNALADEKCRCFLERADNAEQSNERLKAALVKERGCEECWKGQSCGTDCHMNDIALKETP